MKFFVAAVFTLAFLAAPVKADNKDLEARLKVLEDKAGIKASNVQDLESRLKVLEAKAQIIQSSGGPLLYKNGHYQYANSPVADHAHQCTVCNYVFTHAEDGGTHTCPRKNADGTVCGGRPPSDASGYIAVPTQGQQIVEQTVMDSSGKTFTRYVTKPAGWTPMSTGNVALPSSPPRYINRAVMQSFGTSCANGKCGR